MTDERQEANVPEAGMEAQPAPPPSAVAWAPPTMAAAQQPGRTGLAAAAGVILLVLGILGGLLGLFIAVVGGSLAESFGDFVAVPGVADPTSFVGGVIAFVGILVLLYSLVYVIGGIGVLRSRGWGRVMGVIVGILSGLVWLSGLDGDRGNLGFTVVMLGMHVYVVVVLIMYWRPKRA